MTTQKDNSKPKLLKQDSPYCAFKSDRHRFWALVSRDVRLVVVFGTIAYVGWPGVGSITHLVAVFAR